MRKRKPRGLRKDTCSKCGGPMEPTRIFKQAYCKKCHAEHMRLHRPLHHQLHPEAKMKANARAYLKVYIKRGKIQKKGCMICGAPAEAHHQDYAKPLEVVWLCSDHRIALYDLP